MPIYTYRAKTAVYNLNETSALASAAGVVSGMWKEGAS